MSVTYEIACDEHKVKLWIGQSSILHPTFRLYTANKYVAWLEAFLFSHQGCPLRFSDDEDAFADYLAIETDPEDRCAECDLEAHHGTVPNDTLGGPSKADVPHYRLEFRPHMRAEAN